MQSYSTNLRQSWWSRGFTARAHAPSQRQEADTCCVTAMIKRATHLIPTLALPCPPRRKDLLQQLLRDTRWPALPRGAPHRCSDRQCSKNATRGFCAMSSTRGVASFSNLHTVTHTRRVTLFLARCDVRANENYSLLGLLECRTCTRTRTHEKTAAHERRRPRVCTTLLLHLYSDERL